MPRFALQGCNLQTQPALIKLVEFAGNTGPEVSIDSFHVCEPLVVRAERELQKWRVARVAAHYWEFCHREMEASFMSETLR